MVKPGSRDRKAKVLITGMELDELQRFTGFMAESFGLDRRIANYQGVRPIGLYRWDIECLIDVIDSVVDDPTYYPSKNSSENQAIRKLRNRLQDEYDAL
jgi:hypothetical protein